MGCQRVVRVDEVVEEMVRWLEGGIIGQCVRASLGYVLYSTRMVNE